MNYKDIDRHIKESLRVAAGNDDIKSRLIAAFDGLQKSIRKSGSSSLMDKSALVEKLCTGLLDIVDLLNSNRRQEAHNKLFELYFRDEHRDRLQLCTIYSDACFYKMRAAEKFTQYLVNEGVSGMYHIPFELRHKIGNDRYGISGFPVFYLSASAYGCWEELKRPNLEFTNVALFKSTKEMLFIDMVPPPGTKSISKTSILSLPLILASRLEVKHPEGNYIQEYSIPQLMMECLIGSRNKGDSINIPIIGVRYESIHKNDAGLLFTEVDKDDMFVNYAIPPFTIMEKGICPKIQELFYLQNNTSWAEITYKHPSRCIAANAKTHYEESKFGIIENFLNLHDRGMLTYHTREKGGIPVGALTI